MCQRCVLRGRHNLMSDQLTVAEPFTAARQSGNRLRARITTDRIQARLTWSSV